MPAHFTPETMRFLRGLAKNNDRNWFEERRETYERSVKQPLLDVVEEVNRQMADFAPLHVRPAHKIAMRISRDTRFSPDKRPYKTNLGAWWARQGMEKRSGGGFYMHITPSESFLAAGVYAPERDDMLALRRWLAEHHEEYRALLEPLLKKNGKQAAMRPMDPNALTRNPKGFAPDHPAGDLLRARNWGVAAALENEAPLQESFARMVAATFARMCPLVDALNKALSERVTPSSFS